MRFLYVRYYFNWQRCFMKIDKIFELLFILERGEIVNQLDKVISESYVCIKVNKLYINKRENIVDVRFLRKLEIECI